MSDENWVMSDEWMEIEWSKKWSQIAPYLSEMDFDLNAL